ncbi:hypothetical protein STRTUCAR8_07660 [Streptomyces turgidiscabies Car8]|uniref:Uncharacterized protein n=1 Tax=Streptomyces turgidiscabies (strain Car8) TaxID=698760 RepID=L7ESJ9_STRT8|nr:hypothetical protein STRTUCAR8_07660 [Streptomyces turgidiscabies Car8]
MANLQVKCVTNSRRHARQVQGDGSWWARRERHRVLRVWAGP